MNWEYQKEDLQTVWIFSHHNELGSADLLEIDLERDGEIVQWLTLIIKEDNWLWN